MTINVHELLHESILINGAKRTLLQKEKENLNTIVLGSSHGDFGFNPAYFPGAFNLCCRSQDLKHSFFLYKHITEHYPAIGNIVLYYSIFSPGSVMEKSPTEKFISPALNELFNLDIQYEDEALNLEYAKIKDKLGAVTVDSTGIRGFFPNDFKGYLPESYGAANRAADHLRYNRREEANLYLIRLLLLAKHRNHKVCIVVPPVRSDFKAATAMPFEVLFKSLLDILHHYHLDYPVELINGYDHPLFSDEHFGDYDHLLPLGKGTEILSGLVHAKFA